MCKTRVLATHITIMDSYSDPLLRPSRRYQSYLYRTRLHTARLHKSCSDVRMRTRDCNTLSSTYDNNTAKRGMRQSTWGAPEQMRAPTSSASCVSCCARGCATAGVTQRPWQNAQSPSTRQWPTAASSAEVAPLPLSEPRDMLPSSPRASDSAHARLQASRPHALSNTPLLARARRRAGGRGR